MQFLFENNIIHCDLTAENILVKADLTALISDFGWAKELETDVEDFTYMRSNPKTKILWLAVTLLMKKGYFDVISFRFHTKHQSCVIVIIK